MKNKVLEIFVCILFIINFVIPRIVIVTSVDPIVNGLCDAVDNCDLTWSTLGDADWFGQYDSPYYYGSDCAESGIIGDNQYTEINTTVFGPGVLEFYWMVSSEEYYDFLNFYIDEIFQTQISGDVDWQKKTYNISADLHVLTWEYKKDYSVSYGSDCGWLDYVVFITDTISLCEAVDNCDLTWSTLGDADWFGQYEFNYYGGDAAQSGDIGNNQYSEIIANVTGPGVLEFYWKISSEENYDYLNFYIDGVFQTQISGEVNWQKETYYISEGLHWLTWEYKKDGSVNSSSDCGWLDFITFTGPLGEPDLIVTDIWNVSSVIHYRIRNIGEGNASGDHYTALFVDDVYRVSDFVDTGLELGEQLTRYFDYDWECTPPVDDIEVVADYGDDVAEINETNNQRIEKWECEEPNNPPYTPSDPNPEDKANNISINTDLSWTGGDPDSNDTVTYDVYFGNITLPPKVASNQNLTVYNPGNLSFNTTYYWKIVARDNHGDTNASDIWIFTTEKKGGSPEKQEPIADASAGSPYFGFVGEEITFDGSLSYDPDGYIVSWYWDFGDGTNGTGEKTTHIYSNKGTYEVSLTVTDDGGANGTTFTDVLISKANIPPLKPTIVGPKTVKTGRECEYTFVSIDPDGDNVSYYIDWGDGNTTGWLGPNKSGEVVKLKHAWNDDGEYTIKAEAMDLNGTISEVGAFRLSTGTNQPDPTIPIITVTVLGGGSIILNHMIRIRPRKKWEKKAKKKKPPKTCQTPCQYYPYKEFEVKLALPRLVHFTIATNDPVSGEKIMKKRVKGEVVDGINRIVSAHRRGEKVEKFQEQIASLAHMLVKQIKKWLRLESTPIDVSIIGHLRGSEIKYKFVLYHCEPEGPVNVWKKTNKEWESTIEEKHDKLLVTFHGFDPAALKMQERMLSRLTKALMKLIEKVDSL